MPRSPRRSGPEQFGGGPFTEQVWVSLAKPIPGKSSVEHRNVASPLSRTLVRSILPSVQSGIALGNRLGCRLHNPTSGRPVAPRPFVAPAVNGPALGRSPALRPILLPWPPRNVKSLPCCQS